MNSYYIAGIIREADGSGYSVYFPDVPNVCAGGTTVQEAISHATEGLYVALRDLAEQNQEIPKASELEVVQARVKALRGADSLPYPDDSLFQFIPAPSFDMAPVRVNVTIPRAVLGKIDARAKLAGMTRSGYLAAAAMAYDR